MLKTFAFVLLCNTIAKCDETSDDNYYYTDDEGSGEQIDLEDLINDGVETFVKGNDHQNFILNLYQKTVTKHGKCIAKYGQQSRYDLEMKTCFNCSIASCDGNPMRLALCQDYLFPKVFLSNLPRQKEENSLPYMIILIAGVCALAVGLTCLCGKVYRMRKYRYNKTTDATGDRYTSVPGHDA
ncbi:uncharacterized protein LOC120347247 [Styela clava]